MTSELVGFWCEWDIGQSDGTLFTSKQAAKTYICTNNKDFQELYKDERKEYEGCKNPPFTSIETYFDYLHTSRLLGFIDTQIIA